jgi:PhnB protein
MAPVKAIPEGFTAVTPFFTLKGCAEAIEFYKRAFGAEEVFRMPSPGGAVMHAELRIGGAAIMLSEAMQNEATRSSTHLYVEDADGAWRRAIAAGAEVAMPLEDQFWGDRYGVVTDRWGNRWAIAQHVEDVTPEEMQRRTDKMMKELAERQKS